MSKEPVWIVSGVRTPIGSFLGSLSTLSAPQLGSLVIKEAVNLAGVSPEQVNEVYMGCVLTAGVGQAPARQAALMAGLPTSVPCTTVNKVCASGMKAITIAAQSISAGEQQIIVAGGMESMSRSPYYLDRGQTPYGGIQMKDAVLLDALTDGISGDHMGVCTEKVCAEMGITRQMQDDYAEEAYRRTEKAYQLGEFSAEILPVEVTIRREKKMITEDEEFRKVNYEKMRTLKAAFKSDGTITAANASTLNDAAAACVLVSKSKAIELGLQPLAEIVSWADAACKPVEFGLAPSLAIPKALNRAQLTKDDVSLWEINEAFSAVALANQAKLGLDHSKLNIHGGAVSMGHPVGMSGARLVIHLAHCLQPGQIGVAGVCNGGGGATAVVIRKLDYSAGGNSKI